jgi:hypothetical protein
MLACDTRVLQAAVVLETLEVLVDERGAETVQAGEGSWHDVFLVGVVCLRSSGRDYAAGGGMSKTRYFSL